MSLITTVDEVEYPESDGRPMGETDLHRDWMSRILDILRHRYRGQRVYIACDLLLYYVEGEPSKFLVPDVFVVKDADPGRRRTFKIWEEGKMPDVVFEVTSRGSEREDRVWKPAKYSQIGVAEYFLFDPTADYLNPPLQGFRLEGNDYRQIEPDAAGMLKCDELDMTFHLEAGELVMRDARSGVVLLTAAEAAQLEAELAQSKAEAARSQADLAQGKAEAARSQAELAQSKAEAARSQAELAQSKAELARSQAEAAQGKAEAAERRNAELEAEIERLRDELKRRSSD